MSVLPDHRIHKLCTDPMNIGPPMVSPYEHELVQPASIDVRLGNKFKVFQRGAEDVIDLQDPVDITRQVVVPDGHYLTLHPGEFVLSHTLEKVSIPHNLVARVEGKSSLGRLGLFVHVTAGYIDPGFEGQITLEMACLHPLAIRLRPGLSIAQLSFHEMTEPATRPYKGRYQGDVGVVSSRYSG